MKKRLVLTGKAAFKALAEITIHDVLVVVGIGCLGIGLWWIYPPAALITIGVLLIAAGMNPWFTGAKYEPPG